MVQIKLALHLISYLHLNHNIQGYSGSVGKSTLFHPVNEISVIPN